MVHGEPRRSLWMQTVVTLRQHAAPAVASGEAAAVTAIVTAYERIEQALLTLQRLKSCKPAPAEILVHVDGNREDCAVAIREAHPDVSVIVSPQNVGPGGGRNILIRMASHALVASFDDDSYPIDADYFARVARLFEKYLEASVISARVYHIGEAIGVAERSAEWVADFSGGACIYRRDHFAQTEGYVPLPLAYGMEEVDLAIRLHSQGRRILRSAWLRVFHDTDLARHANPLVTASSVANLALLTYLRYPILLWPVGAAQCLKRIVWLVRNGRRRGVMTGLRRIPNLLFNNRAHRKRLGVKKVRSYLYLRRHTEPTDWTG